MRYNSHNQKHRSVTKEQFLAENCQIDIPTATASTVHCDLGVNPALGSANSEDVWLFTISFLQVFIDAAA